MYDFFSSKEKRAPSFQLTCGRDAERRSNKNFKDTNCYQTSFEHTSTFLLPPPTLSLAENVQGFSFPLSAAASLHCRCSAQDLPMLQEHNICTLRTLVCAVPLFRSRQVREWLSLSSVLRRVNFPLKISFLLRHTTLSAMLNLFNKLSQSFHGNRKNVF